MADALSVELKESLMLADYCDVINLFAHNNPTSSDHLRAFKKHNVERYTVDTAMFFTRKGNPIPGGMYKLLFGNYNGLSEEEVHENLVFWASENREIITQASNTVLDHDSKNFAWWSLTTTSKKNPCDEIALWCLCKQYFRHAIVYTPEHTWTTLQDKTLSLEHIDKVCDLHFVYLGYGKFGHITHKSTDESVNTNLVQTSIRSTVRKVATDQPSEHTPISCTRYGQHPQRSTSVHIDYCNLNKGLDHPTVKSPTKGKKRCNTSELTLRKPSASRLASKEHIASEILHDVSNTTTPGQILGIAVKSEEIKTENEKDEAARYKEILGECKKRRTTASTDPTVEPTRSEPILYAHAHGHVCSRRGCTHIQLSKHGVVKPSQAKQTPMKTVL